MVSIALVVIVIVASLIIFFVVKQNRKAEELSQNRERQRLEQEQRDRDKLKTGPQENFQPMPQVETEVTDFKFERFPFDIKDIGSVAPIGEFAGINRDNVANSHFYGNMRNYVFSKQPGVYDYNVYVPAGAEITGFRNNEMTGQFRFNFKIDSNTFYYIDHIQVLSDDVKKLLEPEFGNPIRYTQAVEPVKKPIRVETGIILGQTGKKGIAWDWGVIDQAACGDIINPQFYKQDMCPASVYDFFTDQMKQEIIPLAGYWSVDPNSGRTEMKKVETTPILGKYAHDVKGTLSGGWFKEYSVPYSMNVFFVPDSYISNAIQIRVGLVEMSVFGVFNSIPIQNSKVNPDPKTVTAQSGIVVYTLSTKYSRDTSEHGILLARVNSDDTITVETLNTDVVPANPVFSDKAMILKR